MRAHWSSRIAFVLAAAGSAIGLGNIWKFPYMAGEQGGGAFVLIYLACIAVVGVPILIAEMYVGQASQANVVTAFEKLDKKNSPWQITGWMGFISAVLILSFYSVVGGWILNFEFVSIFNNFSKMNQEEITGILDTLLGSAGIQLFWHLIFMILVVYIVYGGVKAGLERWNKILMPALLGILGLLLLKAFTLDGFGASISFLFKPDFSKLTAHGVLEAVGHSFFTLSLGMGSIITYGSYLSQKESLPKVALNVAFLDTFIALIAGLVIFSIVFTYGGQASGGPGLIFVTLPTLFAQMPLGNLLAIGFFLLVTFAALTSAVSILEVPVCFISEKYECSRKKAAILCGVVIYLAGVLCALSFNHLADFKILGLNFFDLFDKTTTNWLLPIGGILIALFYGWKLGKRTVESTMKDIKSTGLTQLFLWTVRVVAPVAVLIVLIAKLM